MTPIAVKLSGNDSNVVEQLATWKAYTGITPAHLLVFGSQAHWTDATGEFIWASGMLRYLKAGVPLVASIPMCPDLPGAIVEVGSGLRNAEFTRAAKALAGRVQWIRLGWECNGKGFGWGRKATDAQYLAAWNRITDLFLAVSPDFRFIQNFLADPQDSTASFSRLATRNLHLVSLDLYYYPEFTSENPSTAFGGYRDGKVGLETVRNAAKQRGLPWAIDEFGVRADSGPFVDHVADYLKLYPAQWACWWDDNSGFRSRISDGQSGSTGERFKARFGPPAPDPNDLRIAELEAENKALVTKLAEALTLVTTTQQELDAATQRLTEANASLVEATNRATLAEAYRTKLKALWGEFSGLLES